MVGVPKGHYFLTHSLWSHGHEGLWRRSQGRQKIDALLSEMRVSTQKDFDFFMEKISLPV
jgi:hypothetical protein